MRTLTLAQWLSIYVQARDNCIASNNKEWQARHEERLAALSNWLPSGSGLDNNPGLNLGASTAEKLVFTSCDFHHMNSYGSYDGWTSHTVTVRPAFNGLDIRISGRDRNEIKDVIHETFSIALSTLLTETPALDSAVHFVIADSKAA